MTLSREAAAEVSEESPLGSVVEPTGTGTSSSSEGASKAATERDVTAASKREKKKEKKASEGGGQINMAAALVGATAIAAFALRKLLKGKQGGREKGDKWGALIETFDLEPAECPLPPKAPLSLSGRTFVVKDNIEVAGSPTQYGCPAWDSACAKENAKCVDLLLKAGARGIGKSSMSELAFGAEGDNPHYKGTRNPLCSSLIPGGSSSGSAAAVAGGLCDIALGTDTLGSVRIPAACCGVFGMKPTFDAISTKGVLHLAKSFDTVGWFAKDAALLRQVGKVLLEENYDREPERPSKILIAQDLFQACEPQEYAHILEEVARLGASRFLGSSNIAQVKVDNFLTKQVAELKALRRDSNDNSVDAVLVAGRRKLLYEAASEFKGFYEKANKGKISATVKRMIEASLSFASSRENLTDEEDAIETLGKVLNDALSKGKVLILPTLALPPVKRNATAQVLDPWREQVFRLTMLASATGLPQVSIPIGLWDKKIPLSISLIGARGSDLLLLDAAHELSPIMEECLRKVGTTLNQKDSSTSSSMFYKNKGNASFRNENYVEAIQFYSQGIATDETNPLLYSNRAMAYLKLGNFVEAERDCSTALQLDPSNVKCLLRRGTARAYLAQFQESLEDFQRVLKVEPANACALEEIKRIKAAFATPVDG